jgi:hypothetical protein
MVAAPVEMIKRLFKQYTQIKQMNKGNVFLPGVGHCSAPLYFSTDSEDNQNSLPPRYGCSGPQNGPACLLQPQCGN